MNTNIIVQAINATTSDFWVIAPAYDRWVVAKFVVTYKHRDDKMSDQQWLDSLPKYVLADLQRSLRNVDNTNRRLNRDLNKPIVRGYVGRANTSHRKARA